MTFGIFTLTLVVAFVVGLIQGNTIADITESSWDCYEEGSE